MAEELIGLEMNSRSSSKADNPFSLLLKKVLTSEYYILVSDRFDESLLILGQFLGLEVSDLVYKKQKVTPIEQLISLSEAQREVLMRHQPLDSALYKASNNMLDFYISRYPGGLTAFKKNLVALRYNLIQMERICEGVKIENVSNNSMLHNSSSNNWDSSKPHQNGTNSSKPHQIITNSNQTSDLKTRLFCNSLQRDNDEAVRYEWQKIMRFDMSLLKRPLFV
eukprot:CAMPEP_0119044736 /NCGR_PEP_ID=MMETSP1177-20130426/34071_1 /TAXON_ID=2985 /ORGANISM="Ochromonas sp, Strain CCMP1899" /LENGTH=222 /DNA_ID=CAMNT_0007015323 /DNA_START=619 /DNA_END=1287 /DNA_ORIENTATION=-